MLFGGGSVQTNKCTIPSLPLDFRLTLIIILYFERQKAEKMGKRNLLNESDKDL